VLDFHGTSDPVVPYRGGTPISPVDFGSAIPITFRSVDDTISIWRGKDACLSTQHLIYSQGDATCNQWDDCTGRGDDIVLCTIDGGGHTWPGGVAIPPLGKTSTDISATDTMIDFFLAHPLP
jgi:polyhydroxybutyrate depolymerase